MNMVEWALEYALAGWRVLPLQGVREDGRCTCSKSHSCTSPGKHPIPSLVKNGVKQATTDKALIEKWFRMAPYANIGIATGPDSDLYVIDFDYTKGGRDTLDELQERYAFDKTPAVRTGSGGLHLFYAHARGLHNTQGRLGEGVDTRGEGGYVVVPPSKHASGKRYEWLVPPQDMSPSPCPEWVANICRRTDREFAAPPVVIDDRGMQLKRARAYLRKKDPSIQGQGGDRALWSATLDMVKGFALDPSDALSLLQGEFNLRCEPRWSLKDLKHKIEYAMKARAVPSGYLLEAQKEPRPKPPINEKTKPKPPPRPASKPSPKSSGGGGETATEKRSPASSSPPSSPAAPSSSSSSPPPDDNRQEKNSKRPKPTTQFKVDDNGVFRRWDDGWRQVSHTPIWVEGTLQSPEGDDHFAVVVWQNQGEKEQRRIVALPILSNAKRLEQLAAWGIHVTSNNAKVLVDYFTNSFHARRREMPRAIAKTDMGWCKRTSFVWGDSVIDGKQLDKAQDRPASQWTVGTVLFSVADPTMKRLATAYRTEGDLDLWLETMRKSIKTPEAKLMFLASIGTPVLEVLSWGGTQMPNFVVDLAGRTSTGKTTLLRAVASVWGDPGDGQLGDPIVGTWGSTLAYLERVASIRHSLPLILDDTKRARMGLVPKVTYMVANGQGDGRATISGLQDKRKFRTILLSTGESGCTDMSQDGGTRVRAIVLHGSPFGEESKEMADCTRDLVNITGNNFGHAGPLFVQWICKYRTSLRAWVELYENQLAIHRERAGNLGALNRVCSIFAFFDLVEHMVHNAGLLPWEPDERSIIHSLWSSLESQAGEADRSVDALDLLATKAASHRDQFYDATNNKRSVPHSGWLGRWDDIDRLFGSHGIMEVCINRDVVSRWLREEGFEPRAVARAWRDDGKIIPARGGEFTKVTRIGKAQGRMYHFKRDLFEAEGDEYEESEGDDPQLAF